MKTAKSIASSKAAALRISAERVAAGLCRQCGGEKEAGVKAVRCLTCKRGEAERMRAKRAELRKGGLCVRCEQPNDSNGCKCEACAERQREYFKSWYARRRGNK